LILAPLGALSEKPPLQAVWLSGGSVSLNIFSITALETLGNDKKILSIAQNYMGAKTKLLQREADRKIGRDI